MHPSATTLNKPHYISIAIFTTAIATYLGLEGSGLFNVVAEAPHKSYLCAYLVLISFFHFSIIDVLNIFAYIHSLWDLLVWNKIIQWGSLFLMYTFQNYNFGRNIRFENCVR